MSLRRQHWVLLLCAVLAVAHQWVRWDWFIDDAAISFAYARNWAAGEGLVALPGGERVEGYSNPTWVLVLALFECIGLSGFTVAKPLAAGLAIGTLVLAWRIARQAMPERAESYGPLLAPLVLALNAQFALWSTSGLENGLFCFLLALGVYRVGAEVETGGRPWSAVVFLALAWTRPEGLLYAAVSGAWFGGASLSRGRGLRPVLTWVLAFWLPHAALIAARLWYFAWPFPNTYYAKVGVQGSFPMSWDLRGWTQAREFAARSWQGFMLPLYVVALVGLRGRRAWAGGAIAVALGVLLLVPGPDALQAWSHWPAVEVGQTYLQARILALAAGALVLPLMAIGRAGGISRGLCAHLAATSLFFSVYANGDWMGSFRWMSLLAPTTAVLFAVGVLEVVDAAQRRLGGAGPWGAESWTLAALLVGLLVPPNAILTRAHVLYNTNETPVIVKRRPQYTQSVVRRTFHEDPVVNLEMDQGAHMWWFPDYREVDMAGLIDIPMSRHRYDQRPFIREYVFEEQRPTFAHVHYQWAEISGFPTYDGWQRTFIELPPYPEPGLPDHNGIWARRDLFVQPTYAQQEDRSVSFAEGVTLVGFDTAAPTWVAGKRAFIEVAVQTVPRTESAAFSLLVFLSGAGGTHSWDLALGYDGWYPMSEWRPDEIFVGRYAVPLPDDLSPGSYDLGFVVLGPDGTVWPAGGWSGQLPVAPGRPEQPIFARGEVRFADRVAVVPPGADNGADAAVANALTLAHTGACEAAEAAWITAKRHRPTEMDWHRSHQGEMARALATCWATFAPSQPSPAAALARAHRWDHHAPALAVVGRPIGEALWQQGLAARSSGDPEEAYRAFTALLSFQPWRAWARRYAEEARDARLGVAGLD